MGEAGGTCICACSQGGKSTGFLQALEWWCWLLSLSWNCSWFLSHWGDGDGPQGYRLEGLWGFMGFGERS